MNGSCEVAGMRVAHGSSTGIGHDRPRERERTGYPFGGYYPPPGDGKHLETWSAADGTRRRRKEAAITVAHPPLDPELGAAITALSAGGLDFRIRPEKLDALRKQSAHFAPDISLLICRPNGFVGRGPGIYYVHGGGMIIAGNRIGMDTIVDWVLEFGAVAVSIEYRVAPEHPDPAPVEDCFTGLRRTASHADELNIDIARLLVAGTSAGDGLAAAVGLIARDRRGPALAGQVLDVPDAR